MQLRCDVSIARFGILWSCLCKSHREGARGVPIAISGGGVGRLSRREIVFAVWKCHSGITEAIQ